MVVTVTGAFSATSVVPFAGLTVTAAARWADKLAAELVAVVEPLCPMPQAETVIAATNTADLMARSFPTVRQYVVSSRYSASPQTPSPALRATPVEWTLGLTPSHRGMVPKKPGTASTDPTSKSCRACGRVDGNPERSDGG